MSQSASQASPLFNFSRFGRLFRRHTAEHLPSYGMAAAVLAGLLLLLLGFTAYSLSGRLPEDAQAGFFTFFLVMAGVIFTSNIFSQFGNKRQASVALLLPASHLEKFLVAWLYSLPIFVLVYTGVFYLVDALVLYAGARAGQTPDFMNIVSSLSRANGIFWTLAMLHGVWLWGAIYFEKTHFIKTGFGLFLLLGALSVLNFQFLKLLTGAELRVVPPFTKIMFTEGAQAYSVGLPDAQTAWLGLVPVGLAVLLWAAAYCRLTEKQI